MKNYYLKKYLLPPVFGLIFNLSPVVVAEEPTLDIQADVIEAQQEEVKESSKKLRMAGAIKRRNDHVIDTILENVNDETKTQISDKKSNIDTLVNELKTLKEAETIDQDAINLTLDQLKEARSNLRQLIKDTLAADEDLKQTVKTQVREERQNRRIVGQALKNEASFTAISDSATEDQRITLGNNQQNIESLKEQLSQARDDGDSEKVSDLRSQIKETLGQQKELIKTIVSENEDLKLTLKENIKRPRFEKNQVRPEKLEKDDITDNKSEKDEVQQDDSDKKDKENRRRPRRDREKPQKR